MKQGVITLFDVLGWKGVWQRNDKAIDSLIEIIESAKEDCKKYNNTSSPGGENKPWINLETELVSISDTIAVVSYGEINPSISLHAMLSATIICQSLQKHLPVRGAICCGDLTTKGNIFAGPAVDEVASWYEMGEWIGVCLTPSSLFQFSLEEKWLNLILLDYSMPIKGHSKFKTKCVNWAGVFEKNIGNKGLKDIFLKMGPITPDISQKFSNTLDFYEEANRRFPPKTVLKK